MLLAYAPMVSAFEHCPVFYLQDFSGSDAHYVTDFPNGYTARVRWGSGGPGGVILRPRVDDRDRIPVVRFTTFYYSLMCQVGSLDVIFSSFTHTFADRKRCAPLYYGDGVGGFQCGHLVESFRIDRDVLGEFAYLESRASGSWYQSADYLEMKAELDRLASEARRHLHDAIVGAAATPLCGADVAPELIEFPEEDSPLPDEHVGVTGSITFSVARDGTVSKVLLGRTADYDVEYRMASAARDHEFPTQEEECRASWSHSLD